jgi:predicted permease
MRDWRELVRARLRETGADPDRDPALVDEVAQHLEDRYRTARASGAGEAGAERAALRELDGSERLAAELAARRAPTPVTPGGPSARPFAGLWQDLRYAVRTLRRTPGFTIAAVLTVMLSTGPTMAALGVVNWLFFRPVPGVHEPGRLGFVWFGRWENEGRSFSPSWVSYHHLEQMRSGFTTMTGMAGQQGGSVNVSLDGTAPRIVPAQFVTANFFEVLGTGMSEGRGFHPDDDRDPGGATVAVLDRDLAGALFGDEPAVGRSVRLNGHEFTVIGVARADFEGTVIGRRASLWLPARATPRLNHSPRERWAYGPDRGPFYELIVRLRPEATFEQADAELRSAALALAGQGVPEASKYKTVHPTLFPRLGLEPFARESMKPFAGQLLGLAAVLVLLGIANLANLFLFRGARRTHESALRRSLGASAGRLAQLHVVETLLVSAAGAVLGVGIAAGLAAMLDATVVPGVGTLDVAIDWRLVMMAAALAIAVGLLLGLAPARLAARSRLTGTLSADARTGTRTGGRLRTGLAAVQLALSLTLLVGGLLFVQTLRRLGDVDLGFDARPVSTFSFALRGQAYSTERTRQFYRDLVARLGAEPGVEAVSAATGMPLASSSGSRVLPPDVAALQGKTNRELADLGLRVLTNEVTPGYFRTFGMHVVAGRTFTEAEAYTPGIEPGVIISASLAERLFGTTNAVGRLVSFPGQGGLPRHDAPVVGVVNDVRARGPRRPPDFMLYRPFGDVNVNHFVLVRSARSEAEVARLVQAAAATIDPIVPMGWDRSMTELFNRQVAEQRIFAGVLGVLAALGFLLAGIGVYGLVSQGVVERVREFGIRMAIGAGRGEIARLVLRQALVIAAIGVPLGLLLAGLGSQLVESQLFGVTPLAPGVYAAAVLALVAAVFVAVVPPALRAVRVNPVEVMRVE